VKRRDFVGRVVHTSAIGVGGLLGSAWSAAGDEGAEGGQLGRIYQLQAAFHRAKTTQDIDLMMALWHPDGMLTVEGDANSPYIGFDRLKAFWLNSGSFTHRRFSLVPSFKIQIDLRGNRGFLYFECHDVGDYDLPTRSIAGDTFLGGTVRRMRDRWVFWEMTAGRAFPLSVDQYYFP
jgi:hypothetical protein